MIFSCYIFILAVENKMGVKEQLKENEKVLKKYKLGIKQIYKSRTLVDNTDKCLYNLDIVFIT